MPDETPDQTARREADEAQKARDAADAKLKSEQAAETAAQQEEQAAQVELAAAKKANEGVDAAETKLFIAQQHIARAQQQVKELQTTVTTLAQELATAKAHAQRVADALDPTRGLVYSNNNVRLAADAIRTPDLDRASPADAAAMVAGVCKGADDLRGMWTGEAVADANALEKVDPKWSSPVRDIVGAHVSLELRSWAEARDSGTADQLAAATTKLTNEIAGAKAMLLKTGGASTTDQLPAVAQHVAQMLDAVALYAKKQLRFAGGAPSRALMAEHVEQLPVRYETTDATAKAARQAGDLEEFWMKQSKPQALGIDAAAATLLGKTRLGDALATLRDELEGGTSTKLKDLNDAVIAFYDATVEATAVARRLNDAASATRLRDLLGGIAHAVDCELQFAAINQSATLAAA